MLFPVPPHNITVRRTVERPDCTARRGFRTNGGVWRGERDIHSKLEEEREERGVGILSFEL